LNPVWGVPRNIRPDPFVSRGRSMLLLATVGLALLGTTVLSALGGASGQLGSVLKAVALVASVAVNAGAFILAFRIGTARELSVRQVAPGAILAAAIWLLLQTFGAAYIGHVVSSASATNGVFALVLGMLAFLYITSAVVVLCAEINVVWVDKLYPRALLTPFTDNVDLTAGDRQTYATQAEAQRSKGFENVNVTFDLPPHRSTAESSLDAAADPGPNPP
jgi:membrane protein